MASGGAAVADALARGECMSLDEVVASALPA
jgi:hypothetical protein